MRRRAKKNQVEKTSSLVLPGPNGIPLMTFPGDVVDNMRIMITRLSRSDPFPKRLALVAALREEGVTYLSRALATTMAHDLNVTVCVVELNWWWPSTLPLELPEEYGLAAVVTGKIPLDAALIQSGSPNLTLLPAGEMPQEERPVMARSDALQTAIQQLSDRFDHLILDIPAVLATSDAIALASFGTAACLVINQGATAVENVRLALDEVDHLQILGVVMNQVKLSTPSFLLKWIPQH